MANYFYGETFPLYTQFSHRGEDYMIVGYGRSRYKVVTRNGKQYTFPMAGVTATNVLQNPDKQWQESLNETRTEAQAAIKIASPVVISGRGAGKYEGKTGYIAKINAASYGVLIPGDTVVTASKGLVKATA